MLDTRGMVAAAAGLPEQVEEAAEVGSAVAGLPERETIESVLVLGMGGSGIAGDVLTVIAGPFMPVPVVVVKGYEPPSYVSENTLVFAISFSGNTEETIDAAQTAVAAGGRVVAITGGGELYRLAESWDVPIVAVPDTIPQPRAGLGALAVPALVILERMGLFPGAEEWVAQAVAQLRTRRDELVADDNPAQALARRIGRTLPLIYGGGGLGGVAATRWKTEFNENARVPAFANVNPELCHNEVAGWGQHGDVTRQVFTLLELRHDYEHPQVMRRFEIVEDLVAEAVADVIQVRAAGEGTFAQFMDLVMQAAFTSLHLAAQEGLDPGPVPALDHVKAELTR